LRGQIGTKESHMAVKKKEKRYTISRTTNVTPFIPYRWTSSFLVCVQTDTEINERRQRDQMLKSQTHRYTAPHAALHTLE